MLLGRGLPRGEPGRCALLSPATRYAAEIDRRIGFAQVLEERFPNARLIELPDMPESEDEAYDVRAAIPGPGPNRRASCTRCTTSARAATASARALPELGYDSSLGFVAHDLLEVHRSMLVAGALSYVLHQDVHYAVMTAAQRAAALCEGVRGALAVSNPRIEIITAENLA